MALYIAVAVGSLGLYRTALRCLFARDALICTALGRHAEQYIFGGANPIMSDECRVTILRISRYILCQY